MNYCPYGYIVISLTRAVATNDLCLSLGHDSRDQGVHNFQELLLCRQGQKEC